MFTLISEDIKHPWHQLVCEVYESTIGSKYYLNIDLALYEGTGHD